MFGESVSPKTNAVRESGSMISCKGPPSLIAHRAVCEQDRHSGLSVVYLQKGGEANFPAFLFGLRDCGRLGQCEWTERARGQVVRKRRALCVMFGFASQDRQVAPAGDVRMLASSLSVHCRKCYKANQLASAKALVAQSALFP